MTTTWRVLLVLLVGCDAGVRSRQFALGGAPLTFTADELGLPYASSATALALRGDRLYVGLVSNHQDRFNLAVVQIDANGQPVLPPRLFRDTTTALQWSDASTVTSILLHPTQAKLYLTWRNDSNTAIADQLSVYDLDAEGVPSGVPRGYLVSPGYGAIYDQLTALHPSGKTLFVAGNSPYIHVRPLDPAGEPTAANPPIFSGDANVRFMSVSVSAAGDKLYASAYPDKVFVFDLDPTTGAVLSQQSFELPPSGTPTYRYLRWGPKALYEDQPPPTRAARTGRSLLVLPLDANGNPTVATPPTVVGINLSALSFTALSPDPIAQDNRIWLAESEHVVDQFTGMSVLRGAKAVSYVLDASGLPQRVPPGDTPTPPGQEWPPRRCQTAAVSTLGSDGTFAVVLQAAGDPDLQKCQALSLVRDYKVRLTVHGAQDKNGNFLQQVTPKLVYGALPSPSPVPLAVGTPSSWFSLNNLLRNSAPVNMVTVGTNEVLHRMDAEVEVSIDGLPDSQTTAAFNRSETVFGSVVEILVPGYGYEPLSAHAAAIERFTDYTARVYQATAMSVALPQNQRPTLFSIGCGHLIGGEGSMGALHNMADAVSMLGCNTMNAYWWDDLDAPYIEATLQARGITRREMATSVWLTWQGIGVSPMFSYEYDYYGSTLLNGWAAQQATYIGALGSTPANVTQMAIADEPGWYFPQVLDQVINNSAYRTAFRTFLHESDSLNYPVNNLEIPIGVSAGQAGTLAQRRLYYWTTRFFSKAAVSGMKKVQEALVGAGFPADMVVFSNLSNAAGGDFTPSPNKCIGNSCPESQPLPTPDTAMGYPNPFDMGRIGLPLWTEFHADDRWAQYSSVIGDQLRSASGDSGKPFGAYAVGQFMGNHPDGASYKLLSLIGHGAKRPQLYTFGSALVADNADWSEVTSAYEPIAKALGRVGRAERLLHPGTPARGKVALQITGQSRIWEPIPAGQPEQGNRFYDHEATFLHYALTHAGYTVDFIEDDEFAAGDILTARGYTTLYLTQPNVSQQAQNTIVSWVNNGGTLVALPGAAVNDELNSPTPTLDAVLGLAGRLPFRGFPAVQPFWAGASGAWPASGTLFFDGTSPFGSGSMPIRSPLQCATTDTTCGGGLPLCTSSATVLAHTNVGPAITHHAYGSGQAFAYGFYPGLEYWLTATWEDVHQLPRDWDADRRRLAIAPVEIANTSRPVTTSVAGVEARRLDSSAGIAVVLLNWTDQPIQELTVTIPNVPYFIKVSSNEGVPFRTSYEGNKVIVTLPIHSVDVLMLEYAPPFSGLYRVWGSGDQDVYVPSNNGVVLHGDGQSWTPENAAPALLVGVWGSSANDVYVVGSGGTIIHSTGDGTWTPQTSGTTVMLSDVWGSSATDVFAVGDGGTILHSTGDGTWTAQTTPAPYHVNAIAGRPGGAINAVGSDPNNLGFIWSYAGGSWQSSLSGHPVRLNDVAFTNSGASYVVGDGGSILYQNPGTSWVTQASGTGSNLYALWSNDAGDLLYAAGYHGALLRSTGNGTWQALDSGVESSFLGLWRSPGGTLFATGYDGSFYGALMQYR